MGGYSVTSIGYFAFYWRDSLTSIIIPDSVTSMGDSMFSGCYNLACITIPDNVTSIGNSAFDYCRSLTNIIIPDSVTSIGDYAFDNCYSLTGVFYRGIEEQRSNIIIYHDNDDLTNATWYYNSCIGSATHTYDNDSDKECNVCGFVLGDASGDGVVDGKDCASLVRYINGWDVDTVASASDVNDDGKVNNKDYILLVRYLNGWDVELR